MRLQTCTKIFDHKIFGGYGKLQFLGGKSGVMQSTLAVGRRLTIDFEGVNKGKQMV
jgi:hypothetical protein